MVVDVSMGGCISKANDMSHVSLENLLRSST